jgi:colanic acid/amylovoran biosynthesis glycosyltransferase
MRIAYFVNQYPMPSHTFIRREILALEARGNIVFRYALTSPAQLVDPIDRVEQVKTRHVFQESRTHLATTFVGTLWRHPYGVLRAFVVAVRMGWQSDRGLLRQFGYLVEATTIAHWCSRDQVQHLHAHFGTNSAAVALLVHKMIGLPYSFTVHGPDDFERAKFLALNEKVRWASFVLGVSSFGRSQLMRWVEPEYWPKIRVVHCGLDREFQTTPRQPASPVRLVCVGRLVAQKGQMLLIEALRRLRDGGLTCELTLVGDGPLRGTIEQRIAVAGLEKQVILTGWLSGARVREEMERATALVLPSFSEGLPVVIMEAMAMRRPVIATNIAGVAELVVPAETGWLVPAGDEIALADAMRKVLSANPEELVKMGEAAYDRVFERHDINREVEKLESFMQSLERT